MSRRLTIPSPEVGRPVNGYIVIAPLSDASKDHIYKVQQAIQAKFPHNKFWFPQGRQLHVTFAHIITSNVDYPEDNNMIWRRIGGDARASLKSCIPESLAIDVTFGAVEAFPNSIIVRGYDDGTCDKLRQDFVGGFILPEDSRRPPNIIHTTIVRFYDEMDFAEVQEYIGSLDLMFPETIRELYIIHETELYLHDFVVLEQVPAHLAHA